ncbi:MAG TPA: hypothetical protein VG826_19530 [Pirellulales bacterium]|nr:hypothetical protein [Pirellulales bacterium]
MRALALFLSAALLLSSTLLRAEESPPVVGDFGNPDRIVVRGATTFAPAEIVRELFTDLDLANAAYPTAPLEDFQRTISEKAISGYKTAGFAEATAETRPDAGLSKLVLTIVEGPRYLAGAVEVCGLPEADADWLREELTAQPRELDDAEDKEPSRRRKRLRWRPGKPADCAEETLVRLRENVHDLLLERGLVLPEFTLLPRLDRESHTATLEVAVTNPGSPAVLDEILISGNKGNSREDLLGFLGLTPGMQYKGDLCDQMEKKLLRTGRFINTSVHLIKPSAPGDQLAVKIQLKEYANAPPLREALAREDEALIKLSEWLRAFSKGEEELLIMLDGQTMSGELVVNPRSGILLVVQETAKSGERLGPPFAFALVVANDCVGLYSGKRQVQFSIPGLRTRLEAKIEFGIHGKPPEADPKSSLGFGIGVLPRSTRRQHVEVKFKDTPLTMLALAYDERPRFSWNGNQLTVTYGKKRLILDGLSGQLISFTSTEPGSPKWIRCTGEFARRVEEIQKAAAAFPNLADDRKPLTAPLCFLCDEIATWLPGADREGVSALRRLLGLGSLQPLDRYLGEAPAKSGTAFRLPPPVVAFDPTDEIVPGDLVAFSYLFNEWVNAFLPRGSWIERLLREELLAFAGKSRHFHEEISRQSSSPDAGPLRYLTMARTLRIFGMSSTASRCAHEGRRHMEAEAFWRDCKCLLDPSTLIGACLTSTVDALGQLDEKEMTALCSTLVRAQYFAEANRDELAAALTKLSTSLARRPREEVLHELLDMSWRSGLKDGVDRELQRLGRTGSKTPAKLEAEKPRADTSKTTSGPGQDSSKGATDKKADDNHPFTPLSPFGAVSKGKAKLSEKRYR